jgi:hypothetical protein
MSQSVLAVAIILALSLGAADTYSAAPADGNTPEGALHVFLTGNGLSSLKPCGCSEKQLGGFEKRAQVWKDIAPQKRLIVDTGNLLLKSGEQDLIKFDMMVQAFSFLEYDLVNFAQADVSIAASRGYLAGTTFNAITGYNVSGWPTSAVYEKKFDNGSGPFTVRIATVDTARDPAADASRLLPAHRPGEGINILIYDEMYEKVDSWSLHGLPIDVLVCLSGSDTPEILSKARVRPLVISVGRFGKYVGKLTVTPADGQAGLTYIAVPVDDSLASAPALEELYRNYQQMVREENLLSKYPRLPLPNGLEYVGSRSCRVCHQYEYDMWSGKKHAKAWKTLVDIGSDADPECVVCHVVGLKYEGGFISAPKTPELRDVGCEECHGPGSRHTETLGKAKTEKPQADCLDCHTIENSPKYAGNEEEYRSKIVHWKEQSDANSVKK